MTNTKRPRGSMTWDEYEAWLKETGQYEEMVERHRKRDEEHAQRVEAQRIAMIPLMEELRACGCSLSSSGHLTNQPNIPTAIPILFAHLQRTTYPPNVRTNIAYALAVPEIKPHWDLLLRLYRNEPGTTAKDGLANAIIKAVDKETFGDVLDLVRDKRQGPSRLILLVALDKSKDPRGHATIEELADDPDLCIEVKEIRKRWERNKLKQAERQAKKNQTRH